MYDRHATIFKACKCRPLECDCCIIMLFFSQELESENQLRQAEHHYVQAKDWKAAVNMYRNNESWDDSYRVCEKSYSTLFRIDSVGRERRGRENRAMQLSQNCIALLKDAKIEQCKCQRIFWYSSEKLGTTKY